MRTLEFRQDTVNGRRVRQARELRALTQGALADALGVDQTMIAHIERGTKMPGPDLLDGLADELQLPVSFFRQSDPPQFPKGSLLFRSKSGVGKRVVAQAHAHAELLFEMVVRLSTEVSLVSVRLPEGDDAIDAARAVRSAVGAPPGPLTNLVRAIERLGVLVIPLPHVKDFDAFAVWAGSAREYPVIGALVGNPPDRTRMSLAHELGHLVLHRRVSTGNHEMEVQAYKFAAELLMPARDIADELRSERLNLFRLAALKRRWNVSMQALTRRARDLQVIGDRQYRYLMKQMSIRGWRTEEPTWGSFEVERPRALRKLIEVAFGDSAKAQGIARKFNLDEVLVAEVLEACAQAPMSNEKGHRSARKILPISSSHAPE